VLDDLRDRGVQRVFVEGGPTLASAFLRGDSPTRCSRTSRRCCSAAPARVTDIGVATSIAALASIRSPLGDDLLVVAHPRQRRGLIAPHRRHREQLMFTGIVEEIGAVTAVEPSGDGVRLTVAHRRRCRMPGTATRSR
jgi:hypothetical protein